MQKEYLNEKKVGIVKQIILFILLVLLVITSIKGYTVLNFLLSAVFLIISLSIYKKYQKTPYKLIIEENSLTFQNKDEGMILKTELDKVKMIVDDFDHIELVVDRVKYYFHFGMKSKQFKQDLNIESKKKESKAGIFMDFLDIITD